MNPHVLTDTSTSSWSVCQFRHKHKTSVLQMHYSSSVIIYKVEPGAADSCQRLSLRVFGHDPEAQKQRDLNPHGTLAPNDFQGRGQ